MWSGRCRYEYDSSRVEANASRVKRAGLTTMCAVRVRVLMAIAGASTCS